MPNFDSYKPGQFSWVEVATNDPKAANEFYSRLFGWEVDEQEIPAEAGGGTSTMFKLKDRYVAAGTPLSDAEAQMNVPPHWNSYVTVEDAEQTAKKAESAGGTILAPAFDVMDAGRMAIIQDPQGAILMVWEPKNHIGAQIATEPNALSWNELLTSDAKRAGEFYTQVFDWNSREMPTGPDAPAYIVMDVGDKPTGGIMQAPEGMNVPPAWTVYFEVAEIGPSVVKLKELGGQVMFGPQQVPAVGTFATVADPQGAVFSLIEVDRSEQGS